MICPVCGTKNHDTAVKCVKCGLILTPGKVAQKRKEEEVQKVKKSPSVLARSFPTSLSNGRYLVEKKLAAGGMSRVLLARDQKMDCYVVVKELLPVYEDEKDADYLENRFKEEAKLLYRLDHKGLPKVTDYFAEEDRLYFIMRYIDGETLANWIQRQPGNQITIDECIQWMGEILDILIYLHNQDPPVIHRDIKPHNIMIDKQGSIFLVDFGIAREIKEHSGTSTSVGTFGYASPENFTGKFVFSSDLYSLGATFHMLLSGRDPRERPPFTFPPLSTYRNDVPQKLEAIIAKMLQNDASKRFQTSEELKREIDLFIIYMKTGQAKQEAEPDKTLKISRDNPLKLAKDPHQIVVEEIGLSKPKEQPVSAEDSDKPVRPLFAPRSRSVQKMDDDEMEDESNLSDLPPGVSDLPVPGTIEMKPRKQKNYTPYIIYPLSVLVFIGLLYFLTVYIFKVPLFNQTGESSKFSMKAFVEEDNLGKVSEILQKHKFQFKPVKVKHYKKEKTKQFMVFQTFEDEGQARSFANIIAIKGFTAKIVNEGEDGVILRINGLFSSQADADSLSRQIKRAARVSTKVDNYYEKKFYNAYLVSVTDIPTKEEANKLKKELSGLATDIKTAEQVEKH
ncbi:MAG: protein kinase [Firmicutes bacterium]|nr:protein kinase [Bacillota bacterium]